MTAKFWVAKYIDDPVRNEPRNVGVVAAAHGVYAGRFLGERDDGQFDARHIGSKLRYASIYNQWRTYWRERISAGDEHGLVYASPNYFVAFGGEVADVGSDNAEQICQFLFRMLVSNSGALEAYGWDQPEEAEVELESELFKAFNELRVLATEGPLLAKHPVLARRAIQGQHVAHTPSFSQQNGSLYLFEHIDLSARNINKTKERAGWMAYMFADIKNVDKHSKAYSIIRPSKDAENGSIEYARSVLTGESELINWTDAGERERFLEERKRVAEHV